jgi:hypothetical protein
MGKSFKHKVSPEINPESGLISSLGQVSRDEARNRFEVRLILKK